MASHKNRMAEIGFWALPRPGSQARKLLEEHVEARRNDPDHQRLLEDIFHKAQALVLVQEQTGAGFSADKQLREYNREYNGRVFKGSLRDMPGSFNVVEAFHKFRPRFATFELRAEQDHLFSFEHFIDWVTGEPESPDPSELMRLLLEGRIYSYNSTDKPSDLLFRSGNSEDFGFASISMIRFGSEVSVVLVAGQKCDFEEETKKLSEAWAATRTLPHRAHIRPDKNLKLHAAPLDEDPTLWKTVVLMRFDSDRKTVDARYVYNDWGLSYSGQTDDRSAYLDDSGKSVLDDDSKELAEISQELERDYGTLFELCKTCLLLPVFFESQDDDVEIQRHPTAFRDYRNLLKNKRVVEAVDSQYWIGRRDVKALRKPETRWPDRSVFTAPAYKVERGGYWRRLPHGVEGADKAGRPVFGRTWVDKVLSWVEESAAADTIVATRLAPQPTGKNPGYIYVMRSAAHPKDVFKVGLTRRTTNERSKELSSSTSSLDHFLVVEEWVVGDCVQAEKLIHAALAAYRLNPGREFFKASYRTIFAVIDKVISQVDNATDN